ncbi:hypothetical protein BG418_24745 [Streptomyces sp. CBMA152]|nr:hypothetical protein [Streptomyces sp. CBMA152]
MQPLPAIHSAAASSDAPDQFDLNAAAQVREDQCRLGFVLRKGGAEMKAVARAGLHGTDAELHAAAAPNFWDHTPLSLAFDKDQKWSDVKMAEVNGNLLDADSRYTAWSKEVSFNWNDWTPNYPTDRLDTVFSETGYGGWLAAQFWANQSDFYSDPAALASKESVEAATQIAKARYYPESSDNYDDRAAWEGKMSDSTINPKYHADDIRIFLQNGGFPTTAPDPGSLEFRIDVENLKARFASCTSTNPPDPHKVLGPELTIASTEWQAEISGQKGQSDDILDAEAKANKNLQVAAQAMGEAIAQSRIASRLTYWQAYWTGQDPNTNHDYPKADQFAEVKRRIGNAQARATGRVFVASRAALDAKTQAAKVDAAQQAAYAVADAAGLPRGRGLMYAQQAAQITKASAAAALAASKATETAMNATRASVADGKTLNALAMTQAHASKAEFRRKAAEEAASQAKAAADGAALQATKAAENATKAKAAQAKAEAAEKTAKDAAADAKAKRATAETERDNAKAQKEIAATEQAKAAAADKQAQGQRDIAASKLSEAQAAGKTAADKKDAAVAAEGKAATARNNAAEAESNRDVLSAKADALEAKADADDSTDAAQASRDAATRARTAANEATTAATNARAAADDATSAAANAREAATKAEAAAARSKAASDAAQRDVAVTHAAVTKAHAAAADAIEASEAAAQNVRAAKALADTAQARAAEAKADAAIARTEANAAGGTSIQAAGFAYATAQASLAARDSAAQVVQPANDAIELGSPYKETDSSAGLAVLTGQAAKTAAEQQQAVAKAKADQAAKAAADAAKLAAQADADAKAAVTAAAQAADSAAQALLSLAKAQASAKEAADAAKAAKKAEANTIEYDRQATADAAAALSASTEASGYASDARSSADAAEQSASSARKAASDAESDASTARGVADKAETDATTAEQAATRAQQDAKDAQDAATRAENQESRRTIDTGGATAVAGMFTKQEVTPLEDPKPLNDCVLGMGNSGCDVKFRMHFKLTIDFYLCNAPDAGADVSAATCPADAIVWLGRNTTERTAEVTKHFSNWDITKIVDKAVLAALWEGLTHDFVECAKGSISGCAWSASWFVPPAKIAEAVDLFRALDASLHTGLGIGDAYKALKVLGLDAEVMAAIEREVLVVEDALTVCTRNSFPEHTRVLMADGSHRPISSLRSGDTVLSTDPDTGESRAERVSSTFKHDTERLVDIAFADGGNLTSTAGHRVYVWDRGWTFASDVHVGDRLRGPESTVRMVSALNDRSSIAPETVYDLTVDAFHTFYVSTEGAKTQDVLVHNCLNLTLHEGDRGAHTILDHVKTTAQRAIQKAKDELLKNPRSPGETGVWADLDTAQRSVDEGFKKWLTGGSPKQNGANQKKLDNWMRKTRADSENPLDLFSFRVTLDDPASLGTVWSHTEESYPAGNSLTITLKRSKHKPGYIVYTSYPLR